MQGKLILLTGRQRHRVPQVAAVKIWENTQDTLLLLSLQLLRCQLYLRDRDLDIRGDGGRGQPELRHDHFLAREQDDFGRGIGLEPSRSNRELKPSRSQLWEGESSGVI